MLQLADILVGHLVGVPGHLVDVGGEQVVTGTPPLPFPRVVLIPCPPLRSGEGDDVSGFDRG